MPQLTVNIVGKQASRAVLKVHTLARIIPLLKQNITLWEKRQMLVHKEGGPPYLSVRNVMIVLELKSPVITTMKLITMNTK